MHVELGDPRPLFDEIRALGMRVGLAFEPETPFDAVEPYLDDIDLLLVMSVHTGFGGQPFIPEVLDKVRAARAEIDARGLPVEIEIDGGIKIDNAPPARSRPASTSSWRAPASSAPTIPAAAARAIRVAAGVAMTAARQGADRLRRRRRRHARRQERARARRAADRGGLRGRRRTGSRADGVDAVADALRELTDGFAGLVVTTGRHRASAPRPHARRHARGASSGRRPASPRRSGGRATATAAASACCRRGVAGTRGQALICNLPGSASGARRRPRGPAPDRRATPSTSSPAAAPTRPAGSGQRVA